MLSSQTPFVRGQTMIRVGTEVFVFRYDLDNASLQTLGCILVDKATAKDGVFSLSAAYRVLRNVDLILTAASHLTI